MSATNGNGRIHMLTDKQASKLGKQNATLDEATAIAQRVAVQVVEHYMAQIPDLVGRVVEAALVAYDKSKSEQLDTKVPENTGEYPPIVSTPTDSEGPE